MLVKVNTQMITGGYKFSFKIFDFLLRMQLSQCLKSIIILRATKSKDKVNSTKLVTVFWY